MLYLTKKLLRNRESVRVRFYIHFDREDVNLLWSESGVDLSNRVSLY